jgi:hypothetical protein
MAVAVGGDGVYSLENYATIDLELDKIDVKLSRIKSIINVLSTQGLLNNTSSGGDDDDDESSGSKSADEGSVAEEKVYVYERVGSEKAVCSVCTEEAFLNERMCCQFRACNACVNAYIQTKIRHCARKVPMECFNPACQVPITREEINDRMLKYDKPALNIYMNHLNELNSDANNKTCPKCCTMLNRDQYLRRHGGGGAETASTSSGLLPESELNRKLNALIASSTSLLIKRNGGGKQKGKRALKSTTTASSLASSQTTAASATTTPLTKVQCAQCQLVWCFSCHAPWHQGLKCSDYKKGDKLLK